MAMPSAGDQEYPGMEALLQKMCTWMMEPEVQGLMQGIVEGPMRQMQEHMEAAMPSWDSLQELGQLWGDGGFDHKAGGMDRDKKNAEAWERVSEEMARAAQKMGEGMERALPPVLGMLDKLAHHLASSMDAGVPGAAGDDDGAAAGGGGVPAGGDTPAGTTSSREAPQQDVASTAAAGPQAAASTAAETAAARSAGRPRRGGLLHDAVLAGDLPALERALAGAGAGVNGVDGVDGEGRTALHLACGYGELGMAEALLRHGADVNARDAMSGNTPLHYAARYRQVAAVELLLRQGALAHGARNHCGAGMTALEVAEANAFHDVVALLRAAAVPAPGQVGGGQQRQGGGERAVPAQWV